MPYVLYVQVVSQRHLYLGRKVLGIEQELSSKPGVSSISRRFEIL